MKSSSWVSCPSAVLKLSQPFRLGLCICCYFIVCASLDSCYGTADRATFTCFRNNVTRNNWHTVSAVGTWRTLNQHLFETCFIIIPVCCTYVCAVFVTCPSDSMWAFEQDVAYWFAWALRPPDGSLCVCVWVNQNGHRLESVKISGSHSGDCDDCCRRAVMPCNLLDRYCCIGGTLLQYMKKGQWCWEGRIGPRFKVNQWQNLVFVPRRLGQQIPQTRCYVSTELHSTL